MDQVRYTLVMKEFVAALLFSPKLQILRDRLLIAYASHRWSIKRDALYIAKDLIKVRYQTDRNMLPQNVLVSFEATLQPVMEQEAVTNCEPVKIEREYRRRVRIDHPLITHRLGCVSNMAQSSKYVSRVIEYKRDNYRLIIDPKLQSFSIQFKRPLGRQVIFQPQTLTLETLYSSEEGPILMNPLYVRDNDNRLIGVASFLDGLDQPSVKTIYVEEKGTVLYYRYQPDNHLTPFHYLILEKELQNEEDCDLTTYNLAATRLEARLLPLLSIEMGESSKMDGIPKHVATNILPETIAYRLPKLDGNCATLQFYEKHFVISPTNLVNSSHPHLLSPFIIHVLRDYLFVIETDLYSTSRYRPSAIIDIKTAILDAEKRMDIIQELRKRYRLSLAPYYIFFQGETLIKRVPLDKHDTVKDLKDGEIYEVLLDVNNSTYIERVCRHRPDKQYPNSRKVIREIIRERRCTGNRPL